MENVREVMLQSRVSQIRAEARVTYEKFVLDYLPRGSKALSNQFEFLLKNLGYKNTEGRVSVMHVLDVLLSKIDNDTVQQLVSRFFTPMLDLLASTVDTDNQAAANVLLQSIMAKADTNNDKSICKKLFKFTEPDRNEMIQRAGYLGWTIYLECHPEANEVASSVTSQVSTLISHLDSITSLKKLPSTLYAAVLQLYLHLCKHHPSSAFAKPTASAWKAVRSAATGSITTPENIHIPLLQLTNLQLQNILSTSSRSNQTKPFTTTSGAPLSKDEAFTSLLPYTLTTLTSPDASTQELLDSTARLLRSLLQLPDAPLSDSTQRLAIATRNPSTPNDKKFKALQLVTSLLPTLPPHESNDATLDVFKTLNLLLNPTTASTLLGTPDETTQRVTDAANVLVERLRAQLDGPTFMRFSAEAQRAIDAKRSQRTEERRVDVVQRPEAVARRRQKKTEQGRERRRRKGEEARGKRRGF